jgi:hypothetical protein
MSDRLDLKQIKGQKKSRPRQVLLRRNMFNYKRQKFKLPPGMNDAPVDLAGAWLMRYDIH